MAIHSVVLARPHPTIVGEMAPFFKALGIRVGQITHLSELENEVTADTDAVVISLAVTSVVHASVERVLGEVMRLNPSVTLIFSSELPLQKKRKNLSYLLNGYFKNPVKIMDVNNDSAELADVDCFYICGNDLKSETKRKQLTRILTR